MNGALPVAVIALPIATAAALAVIGSWRIGVWLNLGSAGLLFALACLLPWHAHPAPPWLLADAAEIHLVLLSSLIALTSAWFSCRDVPASLAARSLDRRRVRLYHIACQALTGAIMLAILAATPSLTWLGMAIAVAAAASVVGAVRTPAAAAASSRLLLLTGAGLTLALFGTLQLHLAAEPHAASLGWRTLQAASSHGPALHLASIALLLGYGAVAAVVPLHAWLSDAAADGVAPGAILAGAVMVNAPLLVFIRLRPVMPADLLLAVGLASLLLAAVSLFPRPDPQRSVALAGMAQVGMVMVAIGLGGEAALFAAWVSLTLLALTRAAILQCDGLPRSGAAAWTATFGEVTLALLPLLMLFLLAGPAAASSALLLLPLGVGAVLTSWTLLARGLALVPTGRELANLPALLPIWLQLGLVLLFALAMPSVVAGWFRAVAAAG